MKTLPVCATFLGRESCSFLTNYFSLKTKLLTLFVFSKYFTGPCPPPNVSYSYQSVNMEGDITSVKCNPQKTAKRNTCKGRVHLTKPLRATECKKATFNWSFGLINQTTFHFILTLTLMHTVKQAWEEVTSKPLCKSHHPSTEDLQESSKVHLPVQL